MAWTVDRIGDGWSVRRPGAATVEELLYLKSSDGWDQGKVEVVVEAVNKAAGVYDPAEPSYEDGKDDGYYEGYQDGQAEGYEEGYRAGMEVKA